MTTPRDPDTRLRAYLDDGPTELPIRSYEAVDARIARTRQRVVFGPRRDLRMPNLSRAVSIAAAAILVTLALAIATAGPGGSPAPSAVPPPSTSPSLTPAPTPSPSPTPAIYRWPGALAAGTYDTNMAWGQELVFHFTVGDGWQAQDINIASASYRSGLWFFPIANVAAVPCTATMTNPFVADPNGVLAALEALVTFDRPPAEVEFGGRTAEYVEFTVDPPTACAVDQYKLFKLPPPTCPPDRCGGVGPDTMGLEFGAVPHHWRLWLMDVGRRAVAVAAISRDDATAAELSALQGVIDSFRLDTPLATQAPQPSSSG